MTCDDISADVLPPAERMALRAAGKVFEFRFALAIAENRKCDFFQQVSSNIRRGVIIRRRSWLKTSSGSHPRANLMTHAIAGQILIFQAHERPEKMHCSDMREKRESRTQSGMRGARSR